MGYPMVYPMGYPTGYGTYHGISHEAFHGVSNGISHVPNLPLRRRKEDCREFTPQRYIQVLLMPRKGWSKSLQICIRFYILIHVFSSWGLGGTVTRFRHPCVFLFSRGTGEQVAQCCCPCLFEPRHRQQYRPIPSAMLFRAWAPTESQPISSPSFFPSPGTGENVARFRAPFTHRILNSGSILRFVSKFQIC